ncbi:glycosyltransferase family 39 protein [Nonomuraea sp. NPDC050556]|uniref:glycosyltransferase family 39 protein n=1 Tax=Nonomuraea sp. NPDC050556 TaxID=3364369 RepID=UPI0037B8AA2F
MIQTAPSRQDARSTRRSPGRLTVLGLPALVALALGLWGTGGPSLWTDELVTVDVAGRSLGQIRHLLAHVDAVHGFYYVVMHGVGEVVGFGPVAMRLPSVLATVVAAALVAGLGRALAGGVTGLLAGPAYALTPVVSQYALEARSYALVAAVAVAATWALVRAVRSGAPGWFAWYGLAIVALGALHVFALLLLAAHLVTVLLQRRHLIRWTVTVGAALLVLSPLIGVAVTQRSAVAWIPELDAARLWSSAQGLTGGTVSVLLAGAVAAWGLRCRRGELVAVALPWAVLPPVLLAAVSLVEPMFVGRYLLVCVPAVALLVAAGLASPPRAMGVGAGVALLALTLAVQPGLRRADSKWHDVTPAVAALEQHARDGDGFLVFPAGMRALAGAYPQAFTGLRDLALRADGARTGTLHGREVGQAALAARLPATDRVWVIRRFNGNAQVRELAQQRIRLLRAAGLTSVQGRWPGKRMRLTLMVRPSPGAVRG